MKKPIAKWIISFIIVIALVFVGRYFVIYQNWYIDMNPDGPVDVIAKTDSEHIYIKSGSSFERFVIRGVLLDSALPGYYSNDFAIDESTYYEWLQLISQMGANTISVYTILDPDFYSAFYRFNTQSEDKIYLLQGLSIPDYSQNNADDAYYFYDKLLSDGKLAVNVIHGNKIGALGRMTGGGNYIYDVSPWTLGYLIGNEWVSYTVGYTNAIYSNQAKYEGEFFGSSDEANAFETLLARAMDSIMSYESHRYKTQRLFSFSNSLPTDPFVYTESVRMQLEKINAVDAENIIATENVQSGYFASYRMYGGIENFADCLTEEERALYAGILRRLDKNSIYDGYTHFLNLYHQMPVVISGFGHSSARGTDKLEDPNDPWARGRLTEQEQGEALIAWYDAFIEVGSQGAIIDTWQDNWTRTTWNTWFSIDGERLTYWKDVQSLNSGFGILGFDPGDEESTCYVDGNPSEWGEEHVVAAADGMRVSAKYDEAYFYLLIEKEALNRNETILIPIDTTQKSGSNYCEDYDLRLDRQADFLLVISGVNNSRLLVQERYDATRMAYLESISGKNSFISVLDPHSYGFTKILNVMQVDFDAYADLVNMTAEERKVYSLRETYEAGHLRHGNANPAAASYDSLADFCYGTGCVEVRIPWQLLNFSDASAMNIHDDYYEHYGVEEMEIKEIYLGIATRAAAKRVAMLPLELKPWGEKITYHARLKRSYYLIQAHWKGLGA